MFGVVCDEKVTRCLMLCVMDCHTWSEMLCFCDGLSQGLTTVEHGDHRWKPISDMLTRSDQHFPISNTTCEGRFSDDPGLV